MKRVFTALSAFCLLLTISVAQAQDDKPNGKAGGSDATVDAVALAGQLAAYGTAAESPEALALAAKLLADSKAQVKEQEKTTEGEATGDVAKKDETAAPELDAAKLAAAAQALAKGRDAATIAYVDKIAGDVSEGGRGRLEGPGVINTRVLAHQVDVYTLNFKGGQIAAIRVSGDGDTDLDLYVYDENGNLIASDTDGSDECVVAWTPRWTGTFIVRVKNLGGVYNRYTLITN